MVSNSCREGCENWGDNVFRGIPVGDEVGPLVARYLDTHDLSSNTRRAIVTDLRKFARWFVEANREPLTLGRVTIRDISDLKDHLRRDQNQAVSSVNRCLVTLRRFFGWLGEQGMVTVNPAKGVKELRRQEPAPKGLDRIQVRRLLREIELREDVRANALVSLILFTGCRVSDAVALELQDVLLSERSGTVVFRHGKGGKQRSVPLPSPARRALQAWLDTRPAIKTNHLFVGERGPLTDRGVRAMCNKFSAVCGFKIHPHLLRHTMAHQFLADNQNDLVSLAQILGHENVNTTARYTKRTHAQLNEASERLNY